MAIRIVRLGSSRAPGEGLRLGTVRRPPRGVSKTRWAAEDGYDVWFPNLAPSLPAMRLGLDARTPAQWNLFARKFRSEMKVPSAQHDLGLLAALSRHTDFSVGCSCEDEARCHRLILRELLADAGARLVR